MKFQMTCAAAALVAVSGANAAIVPLSPATINGGDTNTASFSDGAVTLTPFVHDGTSFVVDTFNANAVRLGIDNNALGTNNNGFTDGDLVVGNVGDEALGIDFLVGTSGLSQISYDFSRADGPGAKDGVLISGFAGNPLVTFSVSDPNLFAVYDGAGTVRINIPGSLFGGALVNINFNPAASAGQSLLLEVHDTTQIGAQLAIRGISYDNATAIPEPASAALVGLGSLLIARRRRSA